MISEFMVKKGLITPSIVTSGDTNTQTLSIQGTQVINSQGQWIGSPYGLQGPVGLQGIQGPQGPEISWILASSNYTAATDERILANTTNGGFTITLPANPVAGNVVYLMDNGDWKTTNLIVARNGSTIESKDEDLILDIKGIRVDLVYDGSTWNVYILASPIELPPQENNDGKYLTTDGSFPKWEPIFPGIDINNDVSTDGSYYLSMASSTSGSWTDAYISDSKLYFNPSTGTLNTTNYNNLSDLRLKTDVQNIENALSTLNQIRPVSFTWIDNNRKAFGVIAQELEKILPNLVETTDHGMSVSYLQLIPIMIKAIKELKAEIEILKGAL